MKTFASALALLLLIGVVSNTGLAAGADRATITAILVIASNERGPSDPRLAAYEANLKRTLRFESFRYVGAGSASVAAGGTGAVNLPNNNRLALQAEPADGGQVRMKVTYGSTNVVIPPGKTVILAGRPAGKAGEVSAVIVTAE